MHKIYSDEFGYAAFYEFCNYPAQYNQQRSEASYKMARDEFRFMGMTLHDEDRGKKIRYYLVQATYRSACERWRLGIIETDYDFA